MQLFLCHMGEGDDDDDGDESLRQEGGRIIKQFDSRQEWKSGVTEEGG